jgi:hypothetical protein
MNELKCRDGTPIEVGKKYVLYTITGATYPYLVYAVPTENYKTANHMLHGAIFFSDSWRLWATSKENLIKPYSEVEYQVYVDWKNIPPWVSYIARKANGEWMGFSSEPFLRNQDWTTAMNTITIIIPLPDTVILSDYLKNRPHTHTLVKR